VSSPPESAEIIRRLFDAYSRRDLTTTVKLWHPQLTLVPMASLGLPGSSYHGHTGLLGRTRDIYARLGYIHVEASEFREVQGRTLASASVSWGSDRDSVKIEEVTWLFALRDQRVISGEAFATEAEAVQAARRGLDDQFRALFQHSPDAIVINDEQGRFIDANIAACELYELTVDELRRRTIFELVPPDLEDKLRAFWRDLRAPGQVRGEPRTTIKIGAHHRVELRTKAHFVPGRHVTILRSRNPLRSVAQPLLTPRERDVFRLLAHGFTSREIAEQLFVSIETVRTHVQNALARLGAKTRAQAIAISLERGEIEL
jgi:PAS domain S-box-containing protein